MDLKIEGNKLFLENYDIALNPFIKTRQVIMGDAYEPITFWRFLIINLKGFNPHTRR